MKRRSFIFQSAVLSAGCFAVNPLTSFGKALKPEDISIDSKLYRTFKSPGSKYHPFVRWWWNGDKVEAKELVRELHLLKEAGVGGVEINPISFPSVAEDTGAKALTWLSDEWLDMLQLTFDEAKKLDMTCDLIVGSGWPFGAETLKRDERAQVALIYAEELEGPTTFETSRFNILDHVDPGVTDPCPSRTFEILSLKLVPDPMSSLDQVIELSDKKEDQIITVEVPEGKHVFYALVKVDSFACVINGAPGAAGPILNHMDKKAVRKYLDHMSDTIQKRTGPLSNHLRAMFTDSMELEGCNWNYDIAEEFKKRRGYDLMPYLPFTMFKVGRLGAIVDANYGVTKTGDFAEEIKRVRFDFELTKAELLYERFTQTYLQWCKDLNVKSRAQAYGRAFFPLETSLGYDLPEGESWTTNWLKHRVGEEMSDEDYRRGRGYTMINKYVSSAAHLTGKRIVSCEEQTNTYDVFNITLEQLKIGSDMSIMSGITHSVWHGFNYSPLKRRSRMGSIRFVLQREQQLVALLQIPERIQSPLVEPVAKCRHVYRYGYPASQLRYVGGNGRTNRSVPEKLNVQYTSIIWESINKTGGAADYTTEIIINDSTVKNGKLCYGPKKYGTIILPEVTSMGVSTLKKLLEFVSTGGRVFCIEKYPEKSLGLKDWQNRDKEVVDLVEKLKKYKDRFILLLKPTDNRFLEWYMQVLKQYDLPHYVTIEKPNRFFMQTRFQTDDGSEMFFFQNVHKYEDYKTNVTFSKEITKGRYPWIFDPDTGDCARIYLTNDEFEMDFGPAESRVIIFNDIKTGSEWKPLPLTGESVETINNDWKVELRHSREHTNENIKMYALKDLKDTDYVNFTGTAIYRKTIDFSDKTPKYINLGKVSGVSELFVNGKSCGIKWYGNRIYDLSDVLKDGTNEIEVHVITSMGNYVQTLTDNKTAQRFCGGRKKQPIQSMGLVGPVTVY